MKRIALFVYNSAHPGPHQHAHDRIGAGWSTDTALARHGGRLVADLDAACRRRARGEGLRRRTGMGASNSGTPAHSVPRTRPPRTILAPLLSTSRDPR